MFFILIMENLHISFQRVVDAGLFTGIKINSMVNLSHLFYADDAIFLGQWSELNIDSLVRVLDCFFRASGLRINMCKSKIMGVNVEDGMVKNAASKLGCLVLKTPFTYLGTKVGGNMSRKQAWKEVVDKVLSRLSRWKMKLLSIGGRLTLLKSVLHPIESWGMGRTRGSGSTIGMKAVSSKSCSHIMRKISSWWNIDYSDVNSYEEWQVWLVSIRIQSKLKGVLEGVYYGLWCGFARFNTIITSLKAFDEDFSSMNYVRKFLRALHPKWRTKVTAIKESKDLSSLPLDKLIGNLKVHEVVMEKDFEIYKGKKKRVKSIALEDKKETSDDETSISGSDDKEYAMAVRNFKTFFEEMVDLLDSHEKRSNHFGKGMIRKARVIENALDAAIQIISLANAQSL
ncbi:hypothetical protein Tco_1344504 [Tanacetum coccineum]